MTRITSKNPPQRTCVACRQIKEKRQLVRLVRRPDGDVEIDESGRLSGRGAYLCRASKCWQEGIKGKRLEAALKVSLKAERKKQLLELAESMSEE